MTQRGIAQQRMAVVAVGANLGDRAATIRDAIGELETTPGVDVLSVSSLYDTVAETLDGPDPGKPGYLNAVLLLATTLDAFELLRLLLETELRHGRDRSPGVQRWADRTLDLDLIDYGGEVVSTPELSLPHPRAHLRDFVLRPWLEIAPDATLLVRGARRPVRELLTEVRA